MKSLHLKLRLSIALRRIKPVVPLCTLVTLYRSLIQSYLITAHHCGIQVVRNGKINYKNIQNRAGRIITGSSGLGLQMCWIT